MNAHLRGQDMPGHIPLSKDRANQLTSVLDSAINKQKRPTTEETYRGTGPGHFGLDSADDFKVGLVISDKAFVSTSLSQKVAEKFTNKKTGVLMRIKPGAYGVRVDNSHYDTQKEVLMPRGSKFKVTAVVAKKGKTTIVDVEMLD